MSKACLIRPTQKSAAVCSLLLAVALCLAAPGAASAAKVDVNFAQAMGAEGTTAKYGLNLFKVYNPAVSQQNPAYKRELGRMAPGYIRIHSWNMMGDSASGDGWVRDGGKSTYRWDEAKVLAALKGIVPKEAKGMMNIPAWPSFLGPSDQPLPPSNTAAFATFCAQLVQIVNVKGNYGIKYWEVTNERDDVYKGNGTALANLVLAASRAMKKIDPTILVGGPALIHPWQEVVNDFLVASAAEVDFVSYHTYATGDGNAPLQGLFDGAERLGAISVYMNGEIAKHTKRKVELFHNEFNISYAPPDQRMNSMDGAIFDALALIGFAESPITGSAAWNEADGWYGKLDGDLKPRPASYVYELFNRFAVGNVVKSSSDAPKTIRPLAIAGPAGKALLLVNRSTGMVSVDVTGFGDRKAQAAQVTSNGLAQVTLPASGAVSLPAMSVTVMAAPSMGGTGGAGGAAGTGGAGGAGGRGEPGGRSGQGGASMSTGGAAGTTRSGGAAGRAAGGSRGNEGGSAGQSEGGANGNEGGQGDTNDAEGKSSGCMMAKRGTIGSEFFVMALAVAVLFRRRKTR